jgi:hypothetical protein
MLRALQLQDLTASQFRAVFYAGLLVAHPDITLEEVGNLISIGDLPDITTAIGASWTESLAKKTTPTVTAATATT